MTIEEKALKLWGEAGRPCEAIWILSNGILINGCMGPGGLRDVDHAEIGQFFKPSKFQDPGSNWIYIKKFINRGNIRMSFSNHEAFFELTKTPTKAQYRTLLRCFAEARKFELETRIERMGRVPGTGKCYSPIEYKAWIERYAPSVAA